MMRNEQVRVELHPKSTLRNGELLRVVDIQDGYFNAVTLRAERSAILRRIPPEFLEKELRESVLADAFNEILEKACAAGIAEERERCAELCDERLQMWDNVISMVRKEQPASVGRRAEAATIARIIRSAGGNE